ncbi:hypothetical protein E2F46_06575 [Luteimonas aestuarii]|uniref:Uncharacterized protein n=1 Tax=Luteimonas aestuarii TaxID=453837 RepID=A0A4R5TYG8_9GAMM|nr:hypothetical protein [Luteimonas aestuarii]TDK26255.1 hypothetical protein E2F46_06575 [Luteimonas aestuarii]
MDHEIRLTSHQLGIISGLVGASIVQGASLSQSLVKPDGSFLEGYLEGIDVEVEILDILMKQSDYAVSGVRALISELKRDPARSMQVQMIEGSLERVLGSRFSTEG